MLEEGGPRRKPTGPNLLVGGPVETQDYPFALTMTIADNTGSAAIHDGMHNEIIRRGFDLADITVAHGVRPPGATS